MIGQSRRNAQEHSGDGEEAHGRERPTEWGGRKKKEQRPFKSLEVRLQTALTIHVKRTAPSNGFPRGCPRPQPIKLTYKQLAVSWLNGRLIALEVPTRIQAHRSLKCVSGAHHERCVRQMPTVRTINSLTLWFQHPSRGPSGPKNWQSP